MTSYLDEEEFNRWMKNAKNTLRSAENDKSSQFYNWACFKAQQAAEYAIKAYLNGIGKAYFWNSIYFLMKDLDFNQGTIDLARKIDKYYIPTRYTDVWSEGTPEDYYTMEDADEAILSSSSIIDAVEEKWKSLKEE